uniref:Uncharacterized protein n=1 Tax=Amphimedon queenslandica TaxID=400682 RepID=A0A1X7V4V1_AMPQE
MEESATTKGSDSGSENSSETLLEEVILKSEELMYELLKKRKLVKNVIKERLTQRLEEIHAKQQEISNETIKIDDDHSDNDNVDLTALNVTALFPLQCYDEM